ncbi:MAG: PAS domain-containing protein [Bryobacteraceae bacterium]|nr:PAS domain-containing protein [Bryobacteraceae bacterium]
MEKPIREVAPVAGESREDAVGRFLAEALPQIVWMANGAGELTFVNQHWFDYTGMSWAETLERGWTSALHPLDRERVEGEAMRSALEGVPFDTEYRLRRQDGEYRWHLSRAQARAMPDGSRQWLGIATDIEERKCAEEELRRERERLELALNAAKMGTWDWDVRTGTVTWSHHLKAAAGITEQAFEPSYAAAMGTVHPDDYARVQSAVERSLRDDVPYEQEYRAVRPDGTERWILGKGRVVRNAAGEPERMLGVAMDITERKRSEADLRRYNEQLEQFAFAAAHDLQEPLRNVRIYSELLLRRSAPVLDEQSKDFTRTIQGSAERMANLVRDLLLYARAVDGERDEVIDSAEAVGYALEELAQRISDSGASVSANGSLPTVRVFQPHLIQVFRNLIGNALKYRSLDRPLEIVIGAERQGAEWVFTVRDNGIGIHPDYHERIFGVFKRLHGNDVSGTGIGLAIVKRVVEHYGGRVWVESAEGEGSAFRFTLPAVPGFTQP